MCGWRLSWPRGVEVSTKNGRGPGERRMSKRKIRRRTRITSKIKRRRRNATPRS